MRLCQEDMALKSFGVEIFVCKVGATQIKSILAPCPKHPDELVTISLPFSHREKSKPERNSPMGNEFHGQNGNRENETRTTK